MSGAEVKAEVLRALSHPWDDPPACRDRPLFLVALEACVVLSAEEADHVTAALHNCASLLPLAAGVRLDDISEARTALALLTPKAAA